MEIKLRSLAAAVAVAIPMALTSVAASAIDITLLTSSWSGTVGGTNVVENQGNGSFNDVRWGTNIGNGLSGLGFDPTVPPTAFNVPLNTPIALGILRHYNNEIGGGSAATSTVLGWNVTTNPLSNPNPAASLVYQFNINETTNTGGGCCADIITFVNNQDDDDTFSIGSQTYTLQLTGFAARDANTGLPTGPNLLQFVSPEGGTNETYLWGQLAEVVPEPGSLALLATGLLGMGAAIRRRRNPA